MKEKVHCLSMDAINDKQKKLLSLGGNKKFFEFMQAYGLNTEPSNVKYKTKAAEFYRQKLKFLAEGKDFYEQPPNEEEGKKFIKGFEVFQPIKATEKSVPHEVDSPTTDIINNEPEEKKVKKKTGIFNKVVHAAKGIGKMTKNAAKDFGNMTKSAVDTVWEKSKSIKVTNKLN